jgi:plastocyanin
MRTYALIAAVTLAACGGDDAGTPVDAAPATVMSVACGASTPAATFTAPSFTAFSPTSATIAVGDVVEFQMPAAHNAVSTTGQFRVDFGTTACFKFTAAGSFPFKCEPHQFIGTVVVQ